MTAATKSIPVIQLCFINDFREIANLGTRAICAKYNPKTNFSKQPKVGEQGKGCAEAFIETLKMVRMIEDKWIPVKSSENWEIYERFFVHAIGVYGCLYKYLRDGKGEALKTLYGASEILTGDYAEPSEVRAALAGLKWYRRIAEERTAEDYGDFGSITPKTSGAPTW